MRTWKKNVVHKWCHMCIVIYISQGKRMVYRQQKEVWANFLILIFHHIFQSVRIEGLGQTLEI